MIKAHTIFVLLACTLVTAAIAAPKPEVVIDYRQSLMTLIGWNFGPLSGMVKGKIPFDAKEFSMRAERLASLSPQALEGFAKGSDKGAKTDAKAEIWSNFEDFQTKMNDLVTQTKTLADVARTGDEAKMKEQFAKTGGACKACHEKYKEQ